ncbi:hypothetical protein PHYBLDRAFT_150308 [Phycomyces blakesleeanus NRRL 1555(-)]|uniref:Uncharacterized protein n=1 Tax=Phycomyces blakesleeanus (strain ATCC 8743b / DSM 1359 / FGSC 10004 / NBRC 33097 / NRRL 1555) TaxID=763407 RepID=A0A162WKZ2_PHYB8|nr:hypothetical protein PHYBLDRAFT_150308 [Phycomyces blakesleeanus NRRL 1555(-)]OAD68715.1 hypothetical protein PHYBLDRAFT_150308 [Phycomyces blakesleeanus NRRL 1555(-)]|eukprot:XP_018286755.1 hypothetical protein PHYBLDRAFT_150308 [Phycomyces blakesleeanus NRRL 1555(-)]
MSSNTFREAIVHQRLTQKVLHNACPASCSHFRKHSASISNQTFQPHQNHKFCTPHFCKSQGNHNYIFQSQQIQPSGTQSSNNPF